MCSHDDALSERGGANAVGFQGDGYDLCRFHRTFAKLIEWEGAESHVANPDMVSLVFFQIETLKFEHDPRP